MPSRWTKLGYMRVVAALLVCAACGRLQFDATTADGAASDALPGIDAAIIAPPCGTTPVFTDDFTDTMSQPLFDPDNDPGVFVSEGGGFLDVNFQASVAQFNFAYYLSSSTYVVEGLCVYAEVANLPANGGVGLLKIETFGGALAAEFFVSRSFMILRAHESGIATGPTLPGDASLRYWRLRTQGGVTYWDVSRDNVTYYQLGGTDVVMAPMVFILVGGGAPTSGTTGVDVLRFERVWATGP